MKQLLYRTFKPFPYVVWMVFIIIAMVSILFWKPFPSYWIIVLTSYISMPLFRLWLYW